MPWDKISRFHSTCKIWVKAWLTGFIVYDKVFSKDFQLILKNAENNYTANAKTYTNQINSLENEIAAIKVEIANPNVDNILAIVTKNCNITSMETYEYYYKYSDSLSWS